MKKIILLQFTCCILCSAYSQTTFQKTYGGGLSEAGNFIIQTTDGGYAICGFRQIPFSYADGYFLRLSANGDTIWTNMSIGPSDVTAYSITQTADQGYVIAGFYDDGLNLGRDVYLEKRDSSGNVLWLYRYSGAMIDEGYSMQETSDGGFIIAGMTRSFGSGNADMYLVRTDNSGNLLWTQTYGHSGNEYAYSIKETGDGGFIIAGKASVGAGGTDMMLVRTNSTGNILWAKAYGTAANEDGYFVERASDGFIIAGSTGTSSGYSDILLVKTDTSGTLQWAYTYTNQLHDYGKCVRLTADGGYIIGGSTDNTGLNSSDAYMIKTNSSGNILWSKTYGISTWGEIGYCVQPANDGGYILSGFTNTSSNGYDVYLVKTDGQGNSGCNEANGNSMVNPISLQVTTDILSVSSGGSMVVSSPLMSGEGTFATLCLLTGKDEEMVLPENQFSVYPNPSSGIVTILFDNYTAEAGDKILIANSLGQTINVYELNPGQKELTINPDKGTNPEEIYFVFVIGKSGTVAKKFVSIK